MDPASLPETLILRDSLGAMLMKLAAMLVMLGVSAHLLLRPHSYPALASPMWARIVGGVSLLLFAAGTILAGLGLLPANNGLELTRDGFSERHALGTRSRKWRDMREIRAVPRDNRDDYLFAWFYVPMVVEYRLPPPPGSPPTCCIETINDLYGMTAEDLARAMEVWRRRAAAPTSR